MTKCSQKNKLFPQQHRISLL